MKKQRPYRVSEPDGIVIIDRRQTTNGAIIPNYVVDLYLPIIDYVGLGILTSLYRLAREETIILNLVKHAAAGRVGYRTLQRTFDVLEECRVLAVSKPVGRDKAVHKRTVIELLDPPLTVPPKYASMVESRTLTRWLIEGVQLSNNNSDLKSQLSNDNTIKLSIDNPMKLSNDNPIHECTPCNVTKNVPPESARGGIDARNGKEQAPHATVGVLWLSVTTICKLSPDPQDLTKAKYSQVEEVCTWLRQKYPKASQQNLAELVDVFDRWRRNPPSWESKAQPYWGGGTLEPRWIKDLWQRFRLSVKQTK
jgi:hypothetical protein